MCLLILHLTTLPATRFEETVAPLSLDKRQSILSQMFETVSRDTTFLYNTSTDEPKSFIFSMLLAQARSTAETGNFSYDPHAFFEEIKKHLETLFETAFFDPEEAESTSEPTESLEIALRKYHALLLCDALYNLMLINIAEAQADNAELQEHIQGLKKAWFELQTKLTQRAVIQTGFDLESMTVIKTAFAWTYFERIFS